jgi:ABC-type nickel/cobalt efflux system permease component RcnA
VRFFILILILSLSLACIAQANPFAGGKPSEIKKELNIHNHSGNRVYNYLSDKQQVIKSRLTELFREIKEKPFSGAFITFCLMSFIYGVFHSMGPGHAKTLVSGYILSSGQSVSRSALFGALVAYGHAFTAFVLVGVLYFVLNASIARGFDSASGVMSKLSYTVILCVGLYLLFSKIFKKDRGDKPAGKSFIASALVISLTPCPGAMVLSMFAFTNGMPLAGFFAVFMMACGMALTICLVAVATYLFRSAVTSGGRYGLAYSIAELGGIFLLLGFSTLMLI